MERLITLCVLLCLSILTAALPFPEPYSQRYTNVGYGQSQYPQYTNYAQPQQVYEARQQYEQVGSYPVAPPVYHNPVSHPAYGNSLQYATVNSRPTYNGYVNEETPIPPRQNYGNYNIVPQVPTHQQIQNQIEEQIKEQQQVINERLASQIRAQTASSHVLQTVAEPYNYNPTNKYESINDFEEPLQPQPLKPAIVYEQQLPELHTPTQEEWESSPPVNNQQIHATPAPASRPGNLYKKIYHHIVQQPSPSGINRQDFQNLWRKYSDSEAFPKHEKRYLVIHPDGKTEYVDKLDSIAKKHPNYLLVNGGSIGPNGAITPPESQKIPTSVNSQAENSRVSAAVPVNANSASVDIVPGPSAEATAAASTRVTQSSSAPSTPVAPGTPTVVNQATAASHETASSETNTPAPSNTADSNSQTTLDGSNTTVAPGTTTTIAPAVNAVAVASSSSPVVNNITQSIAPVPTSPDQTVTTVTSPVTTTPYTATAQASASVSKPGSLADNPIQNSSVPSNGEPQSTGSSKGGPIFLNSLKPGQTYDSDVIRKLLGDEDSNILFFLVQPQPTITKHIRNTALPDGTVAEETVISRQEDVDAPPTITVSRRIVPAHELPFQQ